MSAVHVLNRNLSREKGEKAVLAPKPQVDNFMLPALDMSVMLLSHLKRNKSMQQGKEPNALKGTTQLSVRCFAL